MHVIQKWFPRSNSNPDLFFILSTPSLASEVRTWIILQLLLNSCLSFVICVISDLSYTNVCILEGVKPAVAET